jgi:hypothetical protein
LEETAAYQIAIIMIRTIITADRNNLILTLPDDFLGKQIEVIAFVIEEAIQKPRGKVPFTVLDVPDELKMNYRFSRDEANER